MDEFLAEIERAAAARGVTPQRLLRLALNREWDAWESWRGGRSSPTLATVARLRAWLAANPPPVQPEDEEAA